MAGDYTDHFDKETFNYIVYEIHLFINLFNECFTEW